MRARHRLRRIGRERCVANGESEGILAIIESAKTPPKVGAGGGKKKAGRSAGPPLSPRKSAGINVGERFSEILSGTSFRFARWRNYFLQVDRHAVPGVDVRLLGKNMIGLDVGDHARSQESTVRKFLRHRGPAPMVSRRVV